MPIDRLADVCAVSPGAIRTTTTRLRRLVGADTIVTTGNGYVLVRTSVDADDSSGLWPSPGLATVLLRSRSLTRRLRFGGATRWRSSPSEDWARPTAVRLGEIRAGAIEDRAELLLRLGEHVRAAAELTAHIAAYPLRDPRAAC